MKQQRNRRILWIITSLALVLVTTVGTTIAFLLTRTDPLENEFLPSKVTCAVVKENTSYAVQNTGDTLAYVRACVVLSWKSADGKVLAQVPRGDEYAMTWADGWIQGADGFYYFLEPVEPNAAAPLIGNVEQKVAGPVDHNGIQYYLSVEVVASAIQATADAVADWSSAVTVGQDGKLTAKA